MIDPSIGRVVWFRRPRVEAPFAAIITFVHNARCVDLVVFGSFGQWSIGAGATQVVESVILNQPGDDDPSKDTEFCEWMPYQIKKNYGSESGEKGVGTESI